MRGLLAGLIGLSVAWNASATDIEKIVVSPDGPVWLGQTVGPGQVVEDATGESGVAPVDLGPLAPGAAVDAHHTDANGNQLFSLESALLLPGEVPARPGDVIEWNGTSYRVILDAALESLPRGVGVDGVGRDHLGRLLLSFDATVQLSGLVVNDEDVVAYDGGLFSSFFDGSLAGVESRLDVDGLHYFPGSGGIAVSFDGSGRLASVDFDDEDVLEYNAGSWTMLFDGDAEHPDWRAADVTSVDAIPVPEPGALSTLAAGCTLLFGMRRRRRAAPRTALTAFACLLFGAAGSAQAADGAIPISQPAALMGGVTAADTPGFPVSINAPGSYVLTSNLVLPADGNAIEISVDEVHIDLNGFSLVGIGTCTGVGSTLACSGNPTGLGVRPTTGGSIGVAKNSSVRDGIVRGFNAGVVLGNGSRITGVIVEHNRVGIDCINGCVVADNLISRNLVLGVRLSLDGSLIDNLVFGNGGDGIVTTNNALLRGNVVSENANDGAFTVGQASVRGNLFVGNQGDGLRGNAGGLVSQNVVVSNQGTGLSLGAGAGYIENVLSGNGQTITGGTSMLHNACNGGGTCP